MAAAQRTQYYDMSPREWTNPRDWTEWREWQRSKHPKLSFRDQLESGSLFSKNAAVEEALALERQKAREQLLLEKRTKVATELSEQMRRDDLTHRLEQMRAQADFDEVPRYFDSLPDDADDEAASSSRKPPPPPGGEGAKRRSKQFPEKPDTEAAFEMPIFPDKDDSFAPPEPMFPPKGDSESRNVPGRASAFKPKVDITIDSSNIETPPGSRSGSRANSRERARAGAAAVLKGIPTYEDFVRDASSAAAAASTIARTSGKMRSAPAVARRPMRPGRA